MTDAALPFTTWRDEIAAELDDAQRAVVAAALALDEALAAHATAKARHAAVRQAIAVFHAPPAHALAARVRGADEDLHDAAGAVARASADFSGLRERIADLEQALREIGQLMAPATEAEDQVVMSSNPLPMVQRAAPPHTIKFFDVGEREFGGTISTPTMDRYRDIVAVIRLPVQGLLGDWHDPGSARRDAANCDANRARRPAQSCPHVWTVPGVGRERGRRQVSSLGQGPGFELVLHRFLAAAGGTAQGRRRALS